MSVSKPVSRRKALGVAAGAAALPLVHIRTAGAAGKLSVGFVNHVVPTGDAVMKQQVDRWAEQNKVEVALDFISVAGNKLLVTLAAEEHAAVGHDLAAFPTWEVQRRSPGRRTSCRAISAEPQPACQKQAGDRERSPAAWVLGHGRT